MGYCSVGDVEIELRRGFSTSPASRSEGPSQDEVQDIIDEVAAELDGYAAQGGYKIPPTDSKVISYLKMLNRVGAAARIESTLYGDSQPNASTRFDRLFTLYNSGIKALREARLFEDVFDDKNRISISDGSKDPITPDITHDMEF
ncbi:hypothetical protein D6779_11105 [Candidatus Parcubacteria bacterium]|nr:MAG: hypothetical protein D6779_11105 [Candidatus Parcubacteria bacterium]